MELKKKLVAYDRTLLIAYPRRMEPKKFGGRGARARRQKRYAEYFFFSFDMPNLTRLTVTGESLAVVLSLLCCVPLLYHFFFSLCHGTMQFHEGKNDARVFEALRARNPHIYAGYTF